MKIDDKFIPYVIHSNTDGGEFHAILRFPNGHGVSILSESDMLQDPPVVHDGYYEIADMGFDEKGQWLRKTVDGRLITHGGLNEKDTNTVMSKIFARGPVTRERWEEPEWHWNKW